MTHEHDHVDSGAKNATEQPIQLVSPDEARLIRGGHPVLVAAAVGFFQAVMWASDHPFNSKPPGNPPVDWKKVARSAAGGAVIPD